MELVKEIYKESEIKEFIVEGFIKYSGLSYSSTLKVRYGKGVEKYHLINIGIESVDKNSDKVFYFPDDEPVQVIRKSHKWQEIHERLTS